jgi:hypothetical protein
MNRLVAPLCLGLVIVAAQTGVAQNPVQYREFVLGSDVAAITKLTGGSGEAKVVHQRPAIIRNLEWRPRYDSHGTWPQTDPVELVTFMFYEDQLFKVVVDYARDRTEGMGEQDVIDAVSAQYGQAAKPLVRVSRKGAEDYGAPDTLLATWGDPLYSVMLFRTSHLTSFRLVVALSRLDKLAQTASAEAVRLDLREAPQREINRQKKEVDDDLAAREKAKIENKAVFRP